MSVVRLCLYYLNLTRRNCIQKMLCEIMQILKAEKLSQNINALGVPLCVAERHFLFFAPPSLSLSLSLLSLSHAYIILITYYKGHIFKRGKIISLLDCKTNFLNIISQKNNVLCTVNGFNFLIHRDSVINNHCFFCFYFLSIF